MNNTLTVKIIAIVFFIFCHFFVIDGFSIVYTTCNDELIFTIVDTSPPATLCAVTNTVINCEDTQDTKAYLINQHSSLLSQFSDCTFDECAEAISITSNFNPNNIPDNCQSTPETEVIFTLSDECDNQITKVWNYTIIDRFVNNPLCENIEIKPSDNQLIISNLVAPNPIIKVFDFNYQIISSCSGDCPETITIPDLVAGEIYHTDIQLYDEHWQFICEDKQDIEIVGGGEPCDTSVCQGDVALRTQAEVDAFCGCEVIDGDLDIGVGYFNGGINSSHTDIVDISRLKNITQINGALTIVKTQLKDLAGLSNLSTINTSFFIEANPNMETLTGLENLKEIGSLLSIRRNHLIKNFNNLKNLRSISGFQLLGNSIEDITIFKNLSTSKLELLEIIECEQLTSLNGLEQIDSVTSSLSILANSRLENIDALVGLKYVEDFKLASNITLSNCCSLVHLFDNNMENGSIRGGIGIGGNLEFCNSPEEILQTCQTPPPLCENIDIITHNNQIIIDGLTAPNEIVKVFDKDFNIVYQCVANCDNRQMAVTFPVGVYTIDLQLYDENWGFICAEQRTVSLENTNPCNTTPCETTPPVLTNLPPDLTFNAEDGFDTTFPIATDNCDTAVAITVEDVVNDTETEIVRTFTATDNCGNTATAQQIITIIQGGDNPCADIAISTANNEITLSNIEAPNVIVKLFDDNYQIIYECSATCESELVIPVENVGIYHTDVQFYNANWGFICKDRQDIEVTDGEVPCDTSVCQGDVILRTQAELDAFCGCEVIEGKLVLLGGGVDNSVLGQPSDIYDLQNFNQLKRIKGDLVIWNTDIVSLYGFSNLQNVDGSLVIKYNQKIGELIGFNSLTTIGSLVLEYNPKIKNLRGIQNISISDNINIIGNENLASIAELINLKTLNSGLAISENSKLENLSGLENLENINTLIIERNPILSNCCSIVHLLDENLSTLSISDNTVFCNSVDEILQNCQSLSDCLTLKPDATQGKDATVWSNGANRVLLNLESLTPYTWTNGGRLGVKRVFLDFDFSTIPDNAVITEASLSLFYNPTDSYESFDVHTGENNLAIQRVLADWDANTITWNNQPSSTTTNQVYLPPSTTETQDYLDINVTRLVQDMITEPAAGNGFLIRLRDEINFYKSVLFASSDHPNPALHPEITICWELTEELPFECSELAINTAENHINIADLTTPIEIIKVFNNNYATIFECFADCEETINITDLPAGTYHVNINAYDENWGPICERKETIDIGSNAQDRGIDFSPADFALYPNPAKTEAFVDLSKLKGEKVELVLFNQFGQEVSHQVIDKVEAQRITLDLSTTQNGLYILKIKTKNRKAIAKKLLVSRLY